MDTNPLPAPGPTFGISWVDNLGEWRKATDGHVRVRMIDAVWQVDYLPGAVLVTFSSVPHEVSTSKQAPANYGVSFIEGVVYFCRVSSPYALESQAWQELPIARTFSGWRGIDGAA